MLNQESQTGHKSASRQQLPNDEKPVLANLPTSLLLARNRFRLARQPRDGFGAYANFRNSRANQSARW